MNGAQAHWQQVYVEREPDEVSWYEPVPETSLAMIDLAGLPPDAPILDVGGGASRLAAELLRAGHSDVTVVDISAAALERAKAGLGEPPERVTWVEADIRGHDFGRQYDLWHDRAVFHFMVQPADRDEYLAVLQRTLRPQGHLVVAAFGPDGPSRCSGLPVRRYGPEEIAQMLGAKFELLSSRLEEHQTPSGRRQQFLYALLRRKADRES